jgi:hypothetical protein
MAGEGLGGRHMELPKVPHELGVNDPDGVAGMDKAAQRVGPTIHPLRRFLRLPERILTNNRERGPQGYDLNKRLSEHSRTPGYPSSRFCTAEVRGSNLVGSTPFRASLQVKRRAM